MTNKTLISILLTFLLGSILAVVVILTSYYKGNRSSWLNTTINNFSSDHHDLAIELKKFTKLLDVFYVFHQFIPSQIPTYSLNIDPDDYLKLNDNLPKGDFSLTSQYKKFVSAQFSNNQELIDAQVRYRGDNANHWLFAKKSWRIKFDQIFENQKAINLILPEDRYFFIEPWAAHIAKKLDLTTPELNFVNLKVNGQLHGVYLKSEQWGEEFLNNHDLPTDANLYGEAEFEKAIPNLYADVSNFKKYTSNSLKPKQAKDDLKQLLDLLNHSSDQQFYDQIENLIDLDNFINWQAQSTLVFSHSQKISHNLIIYHNPKLNKFQFFPWNVAMADEEPVNPDINYNPLMTRVLKKPEYMFKRNQVLWQYIKDQKNLDEDLKYFDNLYQTTRGSFYRDSLKIFPNLDFDLNVKKHRKRIIAAQSKIKDLLNDSQIETKLESVNLTTFQLTVTSQGFSSVKFDSIDPQPVRVLQGGHQVDLEQVLIHTNRDVQNLSQPFLLIPTKKQYTLVFNQPVNQDQISISFKNAITDKIINH